MAAMLRFAAFALLVASTKACCSPVQWEMDGGKVAARREATKLNLALTNCKFHYDAVNFKVAMTMGIFRDPTFRNKTIWDYQKRIMYQIDEIFNTCDVMTLNMPFQPICSPEDGRKADNFFYGGGDQTRLSAITYEYDRPAYSGFVKVTEPQDPGSTCVPIISVDYDLSFMTFMTFENIENGIQDPSVFTPPQICDRAVKRELDPKTKVHPYLGVPLML